MLTPMKSLHHHLVARHASGFTLIELMVALVIGSIVIGAVMALVLSMMRADRDTIAATKLTQELRSVAQVVSSDLRRAGAADDPFLLSGSGSIADFTMTTPAVGATASATAVYRYAGLGATRTVALSNGQVTINGDPITSDVVRVTALSFDRPSARTLQMTIRGQLRRNAPGSDTSGITRSYVQTIFAPGLTTP